jgi:RNA polymerase sigma-70 factor (ECF subfamily)
VTPARRAEVRHALRSNAEDLLAYFERRVTVREDAADLLGETMLQTWRRVDALPAEDSAGQRMWLFTVAANVLANHRRAAGRRSALTERLRQHLAVPATSTDPAEALAVREAVLRLPAPLRELVMLVHWDGFTIVEAATILGVNPSTARGRYAAARAALRDALAEAVYG